MNLDDMEIHTIMELCLLFIFFKWSTYILGIYQATVN